MNMMVNMLPARTWNRLGMNESKLNIDEEKLTALLPQTDWQGKTAVWVPEAKLSPKPMETGMGKETEKLTENAPCSLVETASGAQMTDPVVLHYAYREGEQGVSRLRLHAAADSVLSVVLLLDGEGETGISILRTEIEADERAVVRLAVVQLLGRGFLCVNDIGGICAKDASVELTKLELGADKLYAGAYLDLQGERSSFDAKVGYYVRTGAYNDMNYVAEHHGAKTESLMEVNGTLEENSHKIFRGTIDFPRGCPGAKGTENENVLLLGDKMINQTIPLILCKEEDVEGNHGASIGRLDDKLLFYLSAKGIPEAEAEQIISRSRIDALCERIPDEQVRTAVYNFEL